MIIRILLSSIFILSTLSCSVNQPDRRLDRVNDLASTSPQEALDSLAAIDYAQLSDADKHYYDFLSIKASDKAYIMHKSDSLILKVIDFESQHQGNGRYPEALYYGGRVYSDLGDHPTALHYFQNSLDQLSSSDDQNIILKRRVLSQTGRLLTSLRLYDQAIPYIESALDLNRQLHDTLAIVYDLQLLGGTYLRASNYKSAEKYFNEAISLSSNLPICHTAQSKMYLAAAKFGNGELDSALTLIRHTPELVVPISRNSALAYASNIYLQSEILDTAYIFSHELITSPYPHNREVGYQVILSPKLRHLIQPDSLNKYISDYRALLEKFYDENEAQLAINQHNSYNYQLHEREKAKAEKSNEILRFGILCFLLVIILLGLIVLYLMNRNKAHIIELHEALENIKKLRTELDNASSPIMQTEGTDKHSELTENKNTVATSISRKKEDDLRERLKNELMALYESANESKAISPIILQSEVYQKLQELITKGKPIKDQDSIWIELENIILKSSPKFRVNLNLLTSGNLTTLDLHTALLIKCGIKPSQMTTLFGRSNGTIVSRRETLCVKVLDKKSGVKVIDAIIRLL